MFLVVVFIIGWSNNGFIECVNRVRYYLDNIMVIFVEVNVYDWLLVGKDLMVLVEV